MRKSAEYLQLFDDAEKYSDSELKIQLKTLEKTDGHIWSSLKDIAILTQIKMGVSIEQQEKLPNKIQIDAISLWLGISRLLKSMPEVYPCPAHALHLWRTT